MKRFLIDIAVQFAFLFTFVVITENPWLPIALLPYAMWNFWDGMTRGGLKA